MVNFNLYPAWRECERIYQQKIVKLIFCLAVMVPLALLLAVHFQLYQQNTTLSHRVNLLEKQNHPDKKNRPTPVLRIEDNQLPFLQQLLTTLSQSPDGNLCLTEINYAKHVTAFSGMANAAPDVARYLLTWKAASLFSHIEIKLIEGQAKGRLRFLFHGVEKS